MKRQFICKCTVLMLILILLMPLTAFAAATAPGPVSIAITAIKPSGQSPIGPITEVLRGKAVKITYQLGVKSTLTLEILDSAGNAVRTVKKAKAAAGSGYIQWDGKASGGKKMPYGVHTFRLTAVPLDASAGDAASAELKVLLMATAAAKIVEHPKVWYLPRDNLYFDFSYNTRGLAVVKVTKGKKVVSTSSFTVYSQRDGAAESMFYTWDGTLEDGSLIAGGKYVVSVTVRNGVSSSTKSFTVEVRRVKS